MLYGPRVNEESPYYISKLTTSPQNKKLCIFSTELAASFAKRAIETRLPKEERLDLQGTGISILADFGLSIRGSNRCQPYLFYSTGAYHTWLVDFFKLYQGFKPRTLGVKNKDLRI